MTSSQITIFTGRFGSGKTEIAINYAVQSSESGSSPLLVDLDIVTPYFRSRDRAEQLAGLGVQVVAPFQAGQHIHVPAISPQILGAIQQRARPVVIDLGGDVQGSRAFAQYAPRLQSRDYSVHFVVNPYRPSMETVDGIKAAIDAIQVSAQVRVSHLISNPNLMSESSLASFEQGHRLVREASQVAGLPLALAVVSETLAREVDPQSLDVDLLVIHRYFLMFDTPV